MIAPGFTRTRATWLAYLAMAYYGYCLNILGPLTPLLKDELKLSYTIASLHFTAFAVGILGVGLGGHNVIERLGRRRSLWIGMIGMGLSALLLMVGKAPALTISASFCMGLIGSLILAIVPSALSDEHRALRSVALTEANLVASVVATVAPVMVGFSVRLTGSWRPALAVAALTPILLLLAFARVSLPAPAPVGEAALQVKRPLPLRYWVYWAALLLAVAVEFCMVSWSADYLEHVLGLAKADAAQAVSLFLGAMIVGRLLGSRLVQRVSTTRLVMVSFLVAGAGFLIYWRAGTALLGLSGLFVTGLGVACLYPFILSLAIGAAGGNTDQASARATLASGAAILMLPLVLGRLADALGIRQAYGVVAIVLVGAFLLISVSAAQGRRVKGWPRPSA